MMKITKIKQISHNKYEITIDNETFKVYDELLIKYNLLNKKEISADIYQVLKTSNNVYEGYYKILHFITFKMRSKKEVLKKLQSYGINSNDANTIIQRLENENYLNDDKYLEAYINDQVKLKIIGYNKILFNLKQMGFAENKIITYLDLVDQEVWQTKITQYCQKKLKANHNYPLLMLKQKLSQELLNLGFFKEDIDLTLQSLLFDDKDIKQKEYLKIKKKLSQKYTGEELEKMINLKLMQKGFK